MAHRPFVQDASSSSKAAGPASSSRPEQPTATPIARRRSGYPDAGIVSMTFRGVKQHLGRAAEAGGADGVHPRDGRLVLGVLAATQRGEDRLVR